MVLRELVMRVIKESGRTQSWVAEKMGYAGNSGIANRLAKGDMMLSKFYDILDLCGYEIVVQPKQKHKKEDLVVTKK